MKYLTENNISDLILGSTFFGTGGGLPPKVQKDIFAKVFRIRKKILIKKPGEFLNGNLLISLYGVGDPTKVNLNFGNLVKQSIDQYEKLTRHKISGIIPGEIGAEALAFYAGATIGIPVVDSDLVGGRAAPEISMDVFSVYGLLLTPLLAVSAMKKSIFLDGKFQAREIEALTRRFFDANGGSGIVAGYPVRANEYKKIGMNKTVSSALEIGQLLAKKKINKALLMIRGKVLHKGKLEKAELESKDGFLQGSLYFEKGFRIFVKNENLVLYKNDDVIIKAPDLIVNISDDLIPIHNSLISKYIGSRIYIIGAPAKRYWRKMAARKLWQL